MTDYAIKLCTDGTIEVMDVSGVPDDKHLPWFYEQIGCDMIEIVRTAPERGGYVMVVDEEALLKENPTVNVLASWLYQTDKHGQPICGDVLVMTEEFTDDGADLTGIPFEDVIDLDFRWGHDWQNILATIRKAVWGTVDDD